MKDLEKQLVLKTDDGKEIKAEILFTHHSEEFNKDYVVFQVRGHGEVSAAIYHPTDGGNGSLERIETDEEWEMLEDLLDDYSNSHEDGCQSCGSCGSCHGSCDSCDGCDNE